MYGPSFKTIGETGTTAKLRDMNFAGATGDTMLMIDPVTAAYTELMFVTDEDAKGNIAPDAVAGWYLDNGDDTYTFMGDATVSLGCGFWLFPGNGAVDMTAAGEVKSSFSRTLPNYLWSSFANPFPMKVALSKFDFAGNTGDTMYLINKDTAEYTELMYVTDEDAKGNIAPDAIAGWYLDNGDDTYTYKGDEQLEAGQGCWIFPGNGDVVISASL